MATRSERCFWRSRPFSRPSSLCRRCTYFSLKIASRFPSPTLQFVLRILGDSTFPSHGLKSRMMDPLKDSSLYRWPPADWGSDLRRNAGISGLSQAAALRMCYCQAKTTSSRNFNAWNFFLQLSPSLDKHVSSPLEWRAISTFFQRSLPAGFTVSRILRISSIQSLKNFFGTFSSRTFEAHWLECLEKVVRVVQHLHPQCQCASHISCCRPSGCLRIFSVCITFFYSRTEGTLKTLPTRPKSSMTAHGGLWGWLMTSFLCTKRKVSVKWQTWLT